MSRNIRGSQNDSQQAEEKMIIASLKNSQIQVPKLQNTQRQSKKDLEI
jgi:hypothetical protein